ncbi:hypothetical protein L210DRAFT_3609213 [Boletus edulis BED1]|uniref:C2H2-type domain-containing protein n=1 Tax=Boletus edulis BED1 TaxID=1328754 RepID=A0AAD4C855_BOLED|nr:hypothetical protein L210DRAFT_3609213 [Boletus edulis BED1]
MPRVHRSFTTSRIPCPHPGCQQLLKNKLALTQHQHSAHQHSFCIPKPGQPREVHDGAANKQQCFTRDYHPLLDGCICNEAGDFIDPAAPPPPLLPKIDTLLHLWGVSLAVHGDAPPFANHQDLYETIDATSLGDVPWTSHSVSYIGDRIYDPAPWMDALYEFHFRDPHKLVQNILKNPDFKNEIDYAPYREWEECSDGAYSRRWHDLMSADWAWNQADIIAQDQATHGSAFVPIILGSDKTTVSVRTGQNDYHPIYLSVGNVHNNIRRAHHNALVLLGFLAIPKRKKHTNDACFWTFKKQLFLFSLSKILKTLKPGMTVPEVTMCVDGHYRKVMYGLGPYIADYEEQVILAGIVRNWSLCSSILFYFDCRCLAFPWDLDGEHGNCTRELLEALIEEVDTGTLWDEWGIVHFTSNFPCLDIHALLAPDLLHQLIKGVFKDHLVDWVCNYLEETYGSIRAKEILDDINKRIAVAPPFSSLCRFADGRGSNQWTGNDSKALMKVYLNAIEGYIPDNMMCTFRAFLEFCYIALHNIITEDMLKDLGDTLEHFHKYREIFIATNVRSNFALPRQHAMKHYPEFIRLFGAPNGLCSSITESKHIKAVKRPYRRSNKFNALKQMLLTNQRIDKLAASLVDFTAHGMLIEPSVMSHLRYFENGRWSIATVTNDVNQQAGHAEEEEEERDEGEESDDEGGAVEGEQSILKHKHCEERHRARTVPDLAEELDIPELPTLIRRFLYDQLHPDADVPLRQMPVYGGRLNVFHSAMATFFAPSDPSGIGGMYREHIRATPSWRRGAARYDTVLVDSDYSPNSINGMEVARVLCFFSIPYSNKTFPYALVHWYKQIGSQPDNATGLWMDRSRELSVIHLDSVFHAVHLLPMFGNSDPIHPAVRYDTSLDAFKAYYVNKFADHHSFENLS